MHRHVSTPVLGCLDRRLHLVERVLRDIEWIVGRCGAATGHHLDLRGAGAKVLAGRGEHFVASVGDKIGAELLAARYLAEETARALVRVARIAMPGGLRDHRPARVDARAGQFTLVDGRPRSQHRPTHVAHRCETAQQHPPRLGRGSVLERFGSDLGIKQFRLARGTEQHMYVVVDQAGHQRASAAGNAGQGGARRHRDGSGGNGLDEVAHHQHVGRRRELRRGAVEDAHVLEHDAGGLLGLGRCNRGRGGGDGEQHAYRLSKALHVILLVESHTT